MLVLAGGPEQPLAHSLPLAQSFSVQTKHGDSIQFGIHIAPTVNDDRAPTATASPARKCRRVSASSRLLTAGTVVRHCCTARTVAAVATSNATVCTTCGANVD